ncbi:MAG: cyclopropane-fatty-acyl-phospholipid synthase [Parasulfuritortus sp.]|jgi:cyclopropane-fatty-acyl-phospholipid synthase|nr:cyclopropane-fatty-acyl-phospholipid synthase [Parasulfuritortus sp.]
MNDTTLPALIGRRPRFLVNPIRNRVLDRLSSLANGTLLLEEGGRAWRCGSGAPEIRVRVHGAQFWNAVAFGGSVGAGESFMDGEWDCDDLVGLVRLLLRNRATLDGIERGLARLTSPLRGLGHWLNRNTRSGSRRNIAAHYDLGNAFYRLWLDETMMYSSAVFDRPEMSLAEASTAKLERICSKLDLQASDHVLEIGTGWGGFALYAASRFGCRVTSVTLSSEQSTLARQRVAEAGLTDRVDVQLCDYRDLTGQFDKLVSIEMVEAVGANNLERYFGQCSRLLKADGAMLLQAITIADQRYEMALREVDFIQKHIFPGGFLPSITALAGAMTRSGDLRTAHLEDIGPHYAETLSRWRDNFLSRIEQVRALGFDDRFIRMWTFYLSYCEGGFHERDIGTIQMLLAKPGWRGRVPICCTGPVLPGSQLTT